MAYQPIENYGVIGDLHTVALVGMDGSIDFMCYPDFDSPSLFAALLDCHCGGRFFIKPAAPAACRKQMYLPDTNVLLTRFLSNDGVAEITDGIDCGRECKALFTPYPCVPLILSHPLLFYGVKKLGLLIYLLG
jgi:hypothetical protein